MTPMRLAFALTTCAAMVAVSGPAVSGPDTTPPDLRSPVKSSFTVGGQLTAGVLPSCGDLPGNVWVSVAEKFRWRAVDSSPVTYTLVQNTGRDGPSEVFVDSTQTSYGSPFAGYNGSQDCGGGNPSIYEWNLTATDASGNETTNNIYGGRFRLTQDNNLADNDFYAPRAVIHYRGSWSEATCQCWSQGTVHKTSEAKAAARITFDPSSIIGIAPLYPMHVGLVMHTGPGRGKFAVFVDGVRKATVDTGADSNRPRVVVWQTSVKQEGSVIRVVNLATAGRPRIDLDAVVTN